MKILIFSLILLMGPLFFLQSSVIAQAPQQEQLGLTLGVQFIKMHQYDPSGNMTGDDIYAYNSNNYQVFVSIQMDTRSPQTYNVTYTLPNGYNTVQPGQTLYLGWIRATDRSKAWSYWVQWQVNYN